MRGRRAHLRSSPPRRAGAARWAGWLAAVLAAGLAGACGNAGGAASATPIKIGFVLPLSGTVAANGQDERDGWNLGLKDAGSVIDGHRIQTMFADGAADPTTALTVTHQLVENRGAQLLVGPIAANVGLALRGYIASRGIPTVYMSACSDELATSEKTPNLILTGWTCDQPSLPFGTYVYQKLGYHHITTIGLDFAFGWQVVGGFLKTFEAAGGKVDKQLWNPITTADFSPYVAQIPQDTQAVFALESGSTAVKFLQAYQQFGLKSKIPLIGGGTLTDYSSLRSDSPDAVLGVITPLMYADGLDTPENKRFVDEYHAATGKYPSYYAESAYAGAKLVVTALRKLHGDVSDPRKVLQALRSTQIVAPRGPVKLSSETNSPIQNVYVRKVELVDGVLRNVPIDTFRNVPPWGTLPRAEWEQQAAHYTRSGG
jgi:branched-chain amino acid transport system substrate-binding protein